jgi:DNA phosphorothioation-dependent restriction protein DptG
MQNYNHGTCNFYSRTEKETSTKIIRIGGCKAVGKETARLTGVNETTVSKILMRMTKNFLKKSKRKKLINVCACILFV